MKKSIYDTIKKGLVEGVYKGTRLIKINEAGEREVLIPYTRIGFDPLSRFEHIRLNLEKRLSPGTYIIECKTGDTTGSFKDEFEVIIKAPQYIPIKTEEKENVIDKTQEQETMNQIDIEDYLSLVKENEKLKAERKYIDMELEFYKSKALQVQPLNDRGSGAGEKLISTLSDSLPVIANVFGAYMEQRKREAELKERELDIKQGIKPKAMNNNFSKDKLIKHLNDLYVNDPEEFEKVLDDLYESDPDLYNYACDTMGLIFEDDDENDEQE